MKLGTCLSIAVVLGCGETSPNSLPDANPSRGGFAVAMEPGLGMGTATAIDGARLVVGIPGFDEGGIEAGAVRILDIESGDEVALLQAPEPASGDRFGAALALDPDIPSSRISVASSA